MEDATEDRRRWGENEVGRVEEREQREHIHACTEDTSKINVRGRKKSVVKDNFLRLTYLTGRWHLKGLRNFLNLFENPDCINWKS